jgi:WD40-like Beta Propeller Repeat
MARPLAYSAAASATEVRGPYIGQKPPGRTPEMFALGILSLTNRVEARIAFSPDGNECFFTVPHDFAFSSVQMYYTKRVDVWMSQGPAPFWLPGYSYCQPFLSADGDRLHFTFNKNGTMGIWVVERTSQGWGNPQVLPSPVNSFNPDEYSRTPDGAAHFESDRPGGSAWSIYGGRVRSSLASPRSTRLRVCTVGRSMSVGRTSECPASAGYVAWAMYRRSHPIALADNARPSSSRRTRTTGTRMAAKTTVGRIPCRATRWQLP